MSTSRRNRKPLPVDPEDFEGPVIIGEVIGDTEESEEPGPGQHTYEPSAAGPAGQEDTSRAGRAREFFTGFGQSHRQRRREKRQRAAARDRLRDKPDKTERDYLLLLREDTRAAGQRYMQSLKDSNIFVPGFSETQREATLSDLHRAYTQLMVFSCLRPLQEGIDVQSVASAAGMMTTLYLLSPNFRAHVGEYREKIREHVGQRIDMRTRQELEKAGGETSQLSKKWRTRLEDLQYRERGHRDPYTAWSAGMTEVALAENAFARMREDGADVEEIKRSHREMIDLLYRQAAEDGLSRADVARAGRMVIGIRLETEPELQGLFDGLAHGQYRRSDPHPVQLRDGGPVRPGWTGEFEDCLGAAVPEENMFVPREPMTRAQHRAVIAETMKMHMIESAQRGDLEAFNADMTGCMMGWTVQKQQFDTSHLPRRVRQRITQSQVQLAAMTLDGLSEGDQREAYSNAYVDALETMSERYPALGEAWNHQYGNHWQSFMKAAVTDPRSAARFWTAAGDFGDPAGTDQEATEPSAQEPDNDYQPC